MGDPMVHVWEDQRILRGTDVYNRDLKMKEVKQAKEGAW